MKSVSKALGFSLLLAGSILGPDLMAQSQHVNNPGQFNTGMQINSGTQRVPDNIRYVEPISPQLQRNYVPNGNVPANNHNAQTQHFSRQNLQQQNQLRTFMQASSPVSAPMSASIPIPNHINQSYYNQANDVPVRQAATRVDNGITLDEVRWESTIANPALQQLARLADAKRGEWVQAGLRENPMIGYAADEIYRDNNGKHGVELSQTVIRKYKLNARQVAASKDFRVAQARYETQRQKVVNDAILVAYKTAFFERKCRLLQTLSRNTQSSLLSGKALFDGQEISRADYLELKIQAERTRIALQDAVIAYRASSKELALLLGRPSDVLLSVLDAVESLPPELNEDACLLELVSNSPEIHEAYRKYEAAQAVLKRETTEAGIDFDASAAVLYNTETNNTEVSVGVSVPLKVFDRNQGNIQRAQSELAAAQRNLDRVRMFLSRKLHQTMADYQMSRNRVISYEQNLLRDAQDSFELALEAYKHGEYSSIDLLNIQRTLIDVKLEHLDSLAAFWEAQTLIQGSLLTGGLEVE